MGMWGHNTHIVSKLQVLDLPSLQIGQVGSPKSALLQLLAVDGLRSVVGLARAEPQLIGALRTCMREGLVAVVRPGLRPTGYGRKQIPTDVALLTATGRAEGARQIGQPIPAVSLAREVEHRVGVAEFRARLRIPAAAWTSGLELHVAGLTETGAFARRGLPDGLADVNGMRLAVEYDHGRYTAKQVERKHHAFRRLADQAVWAAPTTRRANWLRTLGCAEVMVIPLPLGVWEGRSCDRAHREPTSDDAERLTFEQPHDYATGGRRA